MTHKFVLSHSAIIKPSTGKLTKISEAQPVEATLSTENHLISNVFSNVVYTIIAALANLWLTPFLITNIGIAAFGMIPLTNSIVAYAAILTTAIYNSVSRFLAIELEKNDYRTANKVFNSAMFALIALLIGFTPLIIFIAVIFPTIFKIPGGWEADASWLFVLTAISFFITLIGTNFSISPFLKSRFLSINIINFGGLALKIGIIILVYTLLPHRLWYVGAASVLGAVVILAGFVILWKRYTPQLSLNVHDFDKHQISAMAGMAGWVMVNMAGALLLSRADLLIINSYFGAAITGGYASVVQLSMLLEYAANAASIVLRPIILTQYARHDFQALQETSYLAIKGLGLLLALPVGIMCGFAVPLLKLWLGYDYTFLAPLLVLVIFYQGLSLSARPLLFVQNACDRVKWPGIVTLISGTGAIILAILLSKWGGWGPAGIPLAIALAMILKNGVYMPIYTAHILNLKWWVFIPALIPGVLYSAVIGGCTFTLNYFYSPPNWLILGSYSAIVFLVFGFMAWLIGFKTSEKQVIKFHLRFGW
ncbi:MAG: lipopolysaccharide biosynthesis protein [Chloroflexota bacterium]